MEYVWAVRNKDNSKAGDFKPLPNPYRFSLKQKGVEDSYYKEIVEECAVYIDYIRAYNH